MKTVGDGDIGTEDSSQDQVVESDIRDQCQPTRQRDHQSNTALRIDALIVRPITLWRPALRPQLRRAHEHVRVNPVATQMANGAHRKLQVPKLTRSARPGCIAEGGAGIGGPHAWSVMYAGIQASTSTAQWSVKKKPNDPPAPTNPTRFCFRG